MTLTAHASPYLELLRVVAPEGDKNRALGGKDTYEVWFVAVDDGTTQYSVAQQKNKKSKFFVNLPMQYEQLPAGQVINSESSGDYACGLYVLDSCSEVLDTDANKPQVDGISCKYNSEVDAKGNAVEYDPEKNQDYTVTVTSVYKEYVLTLEDIENPQAAPVRTDAGVDNNYADPTPNNNKDPILFNTY